MGFSLGIMNKNYVANKQVVTIYMFPYIVLYVTDSIAINTLVFAREHYMSIKRNRATLSNAVRRLSIKSEILCIFST